MKYSALIDALRYGDLSTSRLVDEDKDFTPEALPQLAIYVNEALNDLHSRFLLIENEHELAIVEGTKEYTLALDDLLEILEVWEGDARIALNDQSNKAGVFTRKYNKLVVPNPLDTTLRIVYKATCAQVDPSSTDLNIDLDVPVSVLRALAYYVTHRVYSTIAGEDAIRIMQEFKVKYENECIFLREHGLVHQGSYTTNEKLTLNGWK